MENREYIVQQITNTLSERLDVNIELINDEKHVNSYNIFIDDKIVKYKLPNDMLVPYTLSFETMLFMKEQDMDIIIKDLKENAVK